MTPKAKSEKFILWFEEVQKEDTQLVGGKTASLGEMTVKTDVPVPYGFTTTAAAFQHFIVSANLHQHIHSLLQEYTDPDDTATLQRIGKAIREAMISAQMPDDLQLAIKKAYQTLCLRYGQSDAYVAIRSSATAEDLPDASFAGQQETYLNIKGEDLVVEKIKECYASLFTDRAIFYRTQKNFDHLAVALAAAVQLMVFSRAAGVMFTLNVADGDLNTVLIEAGYGLGEYVVQGTITPDEYLVRKNDLAVSRKHIPQKLIQLVRETDGGTVELPVPKPLQDAQVLTDAQITELAKYAIAIENHYGRPMDIEWGLDERTSKLWILQARPETVWTLKEKPDAESEAVQILDQSVLISGLPASPGIAVGRAHVILSVADINEFQSGEILVTPMTAPDWVPAMRKAKAIITNSGGMTCHAAIVSRELGIPCIVGTTSKGQAATDIIATGDQITVDATNGVIYRGAVHRVLREDRLREDLPTSEDFLATQTKIFVNLGVPELATKVAKLPCDGVGLMREEFIWASSIGQHPQYLIDTGQSDVVIDRLAEGIREVCQAMYPRPVVLRFSDFKTSEYKTLQGGEKYEIDETSALLGWRGASRYYDPKYTEAFRLEVKAIIKVREEFGLKNLWVMLPFVRTVDELRKILTIIESEGLKRDPSFKIWLMAEIPSNILLADKFNEFVDGYSIGSNDLTMLILGCDRDNATVAHLFDERDLAVKRAIKHLIHVAHKDGKTVSICGQAPSVHGPEYIRFLIESKIDSISVNPDSVVQVRKWVAEIEQTISTASTKRRVLDWELK
ncbi:MAG: phosphoenolpyruvate synthase [Candidatus Bathyarchaeota archaeon]|nr:MAG: phosphoenolpyruvate synthase [Candidatus Bathyarchaeota archaeon]